MALQVLSVQDLAGLIREVAEETEDREIEIVVWRDIPVRVRHPQRG